MIPDLARALVLAQIEKHLAEREPEELRPWTERWTRGEVSFLQTILVPRADSIRPYKDLARVVIRDLTVKDFRRACHEGRPELDDVWMSEEAGRRIEQELAETRRFVESL